MFGLRQGRTEFLRPQQAGPADRSPGRKTQADREVHQPGRERGPRSEEKQESKEISGRGSQVGEEGEGVR